MDLTLTMILINSQLNHNFSELGNYFDMIKCVFNDHTNFFYFMVSNFMINLGYLNNNTLKYDYLNNHIHVSHTCYL